MEATALKELRIKLPADIANIISKKDIIGLLLDMLLNKSEFYLSRCRSFEEKYHTDFKSFQKRVSESEGEVYAEWDDLMAWEGYEAAGNEWQKKYEALKNCMA